MSAPSRTGAAAQVSADAARQAWYRGMEKVRRGVEPRPPVEGVDTRRRDMREALRRLQDRMEGDLFG
eukprot:1309416-Prymnesium_polylepis.1